jgi:hypothetical protein
MRSTKERLLAVGASPVASTATTLASGEEEGGVRDTASRSARHHLGIDPTQEAVERRIIRNSLEAERRTQFLLLLKAHFRLSDWPVFVAHGAQNGQQRRS